MNIVLAEIDTGNGVEAEAFKTVDSFKEFINETFEDFAEDLFSQIDEQLEEGFNILDIHSGEFIEIKAYTQYGLV